MTPPDGHHAPAPPERRGVVLVRWLVVRGIAAVFALAFASLAVQIVGLVGERGILSAGQFVEMVEDKLGARRFWDYPALVWWTGASNAALRSLCGAGVVVSLLAMLGFAPGPCLLAAWAIYLSLYRAGQVFLGFQWDLLLLEAGLLAALLAPWVWRSRLATDPAPSRPVLWLVRGLVFKLMLLSGVVKLASGDETWKNLTALELHFETQPLPTWIGWFAHQLPAAVLKAACAGMFAVELGGPWLILAGPAGRRIACAAFISLMAAIALTGNYTFFNLLTAVLSLSLLEDRDLLRLVPVHWRGDVRIPESSIEPHRWVRWARGGAVAVLVAANVAVVMARTLGPLGTPFFAAWRIVAPLSSVNTYGLFAVMTTERPEIVIEGSDDGVAWREYVLPAKPGPLDRRPGFVAPHQPRLDWQLWFAALDPAGNRYWVRRLLLRLHEGAPGVVALFETNPFPAAPPAYLRATLYRYRFTDWRTLRETGAWWRREPIGPYLAVPRAP